MLSRQLIGRGLIAQRAVYTNSIPFKRSLTTGTYFWGLILWLNSISLQTKIST